MASREIIAGDNTEIEEGSGTIAVRVNGTGWTKIVQLTASEYAALDPVEATVIYIVIPDP